ncbi:hypothetical protein BTA51_09020 [Hahella sp. CCB-MM4]|uniref:hypothetical protein n=1 Tax=Hahella sp. (strain CCB-MM4) TaxID=1926491 RepID=UPI000B9C011E|nr:hypothetical protein [Hahella sp. CCB-MM4]OZG73915.1 hypothetical protein BTA51_09020 [Hahella sp. CCB-MM4]
MKKILGTYDSASCVAALWMLSFMLPVPMKYGIVEHSMMGWISILIFILVGVTLSLYRRGRIVDGNWAVSDLIAYFLVPGSLFTFTTVAVLTNKLRY